MTAVIDIVTDSLTELGYLAAPEVPSASDGALALRRLNSLIDQWKAERLMIYQVTRTTWTIVASTASYSVGSGGDVNISRPVSATQIRHVHYQDTSPDPDQEYRMAPLSEDQYAMVPQKALTATLPSQWYYSPTYPLGTLYLLPIPTSSTLQGVIYHHSPVPVFSALSDTVTLPPVYERMIVKNLALELAPSFKKQPNPALVAQAAESLAVLKRENFRLEDLEIDVAALMPDAGKRLRYSIRVGP